MNLRWLEAPAAKAAERLLLLAFVLLLGLRSVPSSRPGPTLPEEKLLYRVDLNSAPWYELVNLPGIGASRAREIVEDRAKRGPFEFLGDLTRIRGIGPVTVERIRDFVKERRR